MEGSLRGNISINHIMSQEKELPGSGWFTWSHYDLLFPVLGEAVANDCQVTWEQ